MGRYYNGDIEGKFWFGVQPSNAASRFGGQECEPNVISYYFDKEEHYDTLCKELAKIKNFLGTRHAKLDKFFAEHDGYNETMLIEAGFSKHDLNKVLGEYADYQLGMEIKKCLDDNGTCSFEAEC